MRTMVSLGLALILVGSSAAAGLEERYSAANPTLEMSRVQYKGAAALRAVDRPDEAIDPLIPLPVIDFADGMIEAEVAGLPADGAPEGSRGFIGIAFRVQSDPTRYEAFYIRPTNGRADDQLRRNHSTQYVGMPDYPWHRLRTEAPGVYESYADMVAGDWTRLKIVVEGAAARLYVGEASQPSLIVNDLKLGGSARGGVALWVGQGTDGYFRNVRVAKSN